MDAIQAYREAGTATDNPVHLIVVLYDQLLRDLRNAIAAFEQHDVPRRCQEIDHALLVIAELQGRLNFDRGGEVAETLDRFYGWMRAELLRSTIESSSTALERQVQNILGVREAWLEVERQQTPVQQKNSSPAQKFGDDSTTQGSSEWKA